MHFNEYTGTGSICVRWVQPPDCNFGEEVLLLVTQCYWEYLWDSMLESTLDPDTRPREIHVGIRAQMDSFEYFFGVSAG